MPFIMVGIFGAVLLGCSHQSPTEPKPKLTNLGVVEMSDGVPIYRGLGGDQACVITPTVMSNGLRLAFVIEQTNSAGVVRTLATPVAELTGPARTVEVTAGEVALRVTPKIKPRAAQGGDSILPGRHLSETQVAEIVGRELPQMSGFRCEFHDGVWEILEVQPGVWGVSSRTTNAEGRITVASTNATRVVLRVRDADGKVDAVKTP